jgi:lincosamide nucleotidyltransferase B/F
MIPQHAMIARVRTLCIHDPRILAALMYGSFTRDEGDQFSDIEFYLFLHTQELQQFDPIAWLNQVAPLAAYFVNEFGTGVALFANLIRGEFHFVSIDDIALIGQWSADDSHRVAPHMLIVDHTGALTLQLERFAQSRPDRTSPQALMQLTDRFLNWWLLAAQVLRRGEHARALDTLSWVQRYLLWMARAVEGAFLHWPTPSRAVERDLSPAAYQRFQACTASLDRQSLQTALYASWTWGCELMQHLEAQYTVGLRTELIQQITEVLPAWFSDTPTLAAVRPGGAAERPHPDDGNSQRQ